MDPELATSLEVEAMVRRYLGKVARRYIPLVVALVVLLLVVTLVPTVSPKSQLANQAFGPNAIANSTGPGATVPGATANTSASTVAGAAGAADTGSINLASTPGSVSSGTGGITTPAPAGGAGVARSGVQCGAGVLQVKWTVYAPPCQPAFSGSNGAATSYGVSKDTITAVFRRTGSAEEKAAYAAVGKAAPGTDDQYLADLRTYLGLFNKTYELYGRQLVVKDFTGQGDNLQEDQGLDLQGAQADAATAHDLGAFMDITMSPTLASTQPYEEDLAQQHVVTVGAIGLPQSWFQQHAPYEYEYPLAPDGTKAAQGVSNSLCARAVGMPAIYSGDPVLQHQTRSFGLITPENDVYIELGNELQSDFQKQCGGTFKKRVTYTINIGEMPSESVGVIAQMHSAGVSTVVCICDPIVEITISEAAKSQQYYPEWLATPWVDPQGRDMDQSEWSHAISTEGTYPPKARSEAYKVFKLAAAAAGNPNLEPQEQYYFVAFYMLSYVFNVLQRAGPNLNPNTFHDSAYSMPRTGTGDIGTWGGGPQGYSPQLDSKVGYWDPNATSNFDGGKGAWIDCEGGKYFPYTDPSLWGPRQQFHCFGH